MTITYLETIDSTQSYLKKLLKDKSILLPHAVVCELQTNGVGSRNNSWEGFRGNFFLSFALPLENLPKDLQLESASIYFACLLKEVLSSLNSKVWLKWPNDFYIDNFKIGGMITNIVDRSIVCGVGINLVNAPEGFKCLDISISREVLLDKYFKLIEKKVSWKQIFSIYKIEFEGNQKYFTHNNNLKISLQNAVLENDGSITVDGERIYSTR